MEEHCTLHVFFLVGSSVSQMENTDEKKDPEALQRFLLASQSFPEGSGSGGDSQKGWSPLISSFVKYFTECKRYFL